MQTITDLKKIYQAVCDAKRAGATIGVVPTMGALHDGHLSLVREAKKNCDFVVATIFVNPAQFSPSEDLEKYPRPIEKDLSLLKSHGVELAFCPENEAMYPDGYSAFVQPPVISLPLEGNFRKTHFQGVATIVLKLFQLVPADYAFFGQKDYQQTLVIRRMVEDFNVPIQVVTCPILRELDGLAMSSRNVYLNDADRKRANCINQLLCDIEKLVISQTKQSQSTPSEAKLPITKLNEIISTHKSKLSKSVDSIDYLELVDANSLKPLTSESKAAVVLAAVHVSGTRLIDNRIIYLT